MARKKKKGPIVCKPSQLGPRPEYMLLSLLCLNIDPSYQRKPSTARVYKKTANFRWAQCGVLTVNKRRDGTYWVVDGQHRLLALRIIFGGEDALVPCLVTSNLNQKEEAVACAEARLFVEKQMKRVGLSSREQYRAGIKGKQPDWLAVKTAIDAVGRDAYATGKKNPNAVPALGLLIDVAQGNPSVKGSQHGHARVKKLMRYGDKVCKGKPVTDVILRGLRVLMNRCHRAKVNPTQGIERIARVDPDVLTFDARVMASHNASTFKKEIAYVMRNAANKNVSPSSPYYIPRLPS